MHVLGLVSLVTAARAGETPAGSAGSPPTGPADAPTPPAAPALGPPATVLEHSVVVTVDATRRARETVRWTVRVDDPAACAAGVVAPPGLDGATDDGAQVLETLFVAPPETAPGTTFSFVSTRSWAPNGHSGVFTVSPDVPTEHASLSVQVPPSVPLAVWADAGGALRNGEPRKVTVEWDRIEPGGVGRAAWSTWSDWIEAGRTVRAAVDEKIDVRRWTLGKELTQDLDGLGLGGVVARVRETVELDPGPSDWLHTTNALEVFEAGHGSAADRGLAMIALLRSAGFEAGPAMYRPGSDPAGFPVTVPAPALFPQPLVVVRRPAPHDDLVWIDPAAEHTATPEPPAALTGAMVWVPSAPTGPGSAGLPGPGELPLRMTQDQVADGAVTLLTTAEVSPDGALTLRTSLQATGTASEILRDLLDPLDEAGLDETFARLLAQARPDLQQVDASATGIEDPADKLTLTVQAHQPNALAPTSYGLRGTIPPALGPALAGWLPPRVLVHETVDLSIPPTMEWAGTAGEPSTWFTVGRTAGSVGRTVRRDGQRVVFETTVERPGLQRTPATDAAAAELLATEAPKGVDALLFDGGSSVRRLRGAADVAPADRAALELLVRSANQSPRKAERALRRTLPEVGFDPLVAALLRFGDPADHRPWQALAQQQGLGDLRRVELAEAVERAGVRSGALEMARVLVESADPEVRVRSRLMIERLQGPAGSTDPLWVDPAKLLAEAAAAGPDPRVDIRQAELRLDASDGAEARALLEPLLQRPADALPALTSVDGARIRALLAHADALSGVPADQVRRAAAAAIDEAPGAPVVVSAAAGALAAIGDDGAALDHAITAARLAVHDPDRWARVIPIALRAGDLRAAAEAARKASDLDPDSAPRARRWADLAYALADREQVDAARARAGMEPVGDWPPMIDLRMAVDPEAVLAVLIHDDAVVTASPRLLAVRSQLRIERGMLDEAAQDALVLALRHEKPEGWALAFTATAGRQYWTRAAEALDQAAKTEPTAIATRMEHRLIAGTGDPLEDARRLPDDPRAKALLELVASPRAAAAKVPGWPDPLPAPPQRSVAGFRPSRVLSATPGTVGLSSPADGAAIVRVGAVTGGVVPPVVGLLYPDPPLPVQRLEGGGQVLRLMGGTIPLYAALRAIDGHEVWAFAFTPATAARMLALAAPPAPSVKKSD